MSAAMGRLENDLTWLDDLDAGQLSLRIGTTEETIRRLAEDVGEDELTLALFARGTPPEDTGWTTEDGCAAFVASTQRSITEKQAQLADLRDRLAALEAAEQVPA